MSKAARKGKILYGENDAAVLKEQAQSLIAAGYTVESAIARKGISEALAHGHFDVVILGHTLSKNDRHHLPYIAKKSSEATRVLVLHNSGHHHAVDLTIDSRHGEEKILQAVAKLMAMELVSA